MVMLVLVSTFLASMLLICSVYYLLQSDSDIYRLFWSLLIVLNSMTIFLNLLTYISLRGKL